MISKLTSFLTRKKGGCLSFATGYDNRHFYLRILKKLIKNETGPFMTLINYIFQIRIKTISFIAST